jgi:hypothetical protein
MATPEEIPDHNNSDRNDANEYDQQRQLNDVRA